MSNSNHEWIIEELIDLGLGVEELAAETGLEVYKVESWLHNESPSDCLTMAKLTALIVRRLVPAWSIETP